MKPDPRIEAEVARTLRSLDGLERASPKPFFGSRVEARLARRRETQTIGVGWVFRPGRLVAALGLVLVLNVSVVVYVAWPDRPVKVQRAGQLATELGIAQLLTGW